MQVKVLQDHGSVRSTKFIDLLTLPLRLTKIGPKVKVSVNGTKALGNKPKKVCIYTANVSPIKSVGIPVLHGVPPHHSKM